MDDGTADDGGDDTTRSSAEAELGAAVDEAMELELKRQKARFVQRILGIDRAEGTGRRDEQWNEGLDRELGIDPLDDPPR
jgi:hypothetical protein